MAPNIFLIGDTHFGHKNIINFESVNPYRPFVSIEEDDEELVNAGTVLCASRTPFGTRRLAFESTKERERGQNKMEHRTIGDALSEGFRQWKKGNPDWQTYLENPASLNDPARARQRRQEIYETLADCPLKYLQRILNAARLPPHPNRGHWKRFLIREGMIMAQHARGQYLPFHKEMEHALAHVFETMDKEFFDYKGADGLACVKNHIETWFDTHIRQPAAEAFADRNRQQHKRA